VVHGIQGVKGQLNMIYDRSYSKPRINCTARDNNDDDDCLSALIQQV